MSHEEFMKGALECNAINNVKDELGKDSQVFLYSSQLKVMENWNYLSRKMVGAKRV